MRTFLAATLACLGASAPLAAQEPPDAAAPSAPQFEEQVDVVAVTPLHGSGIPLLKVPANVQIFAAERPAGATTDVPGLLNTRAAGVHTVDAQAGAYQPDLLFRGFAASPLLGASEGLAVYQDGVRINEAFGDTVNWDLIPSSAIASMNLMPGSNPLFGLNALGGALSMRMKDGFDHPGQQVLVTSGSFGRHRVDGQSGGRAGTLAYFLAGSLVDEEGWRDHSPSTVRRVYGNLGWRGAASAVTLSVTAASNDLTGNGAAPLDLLRTRRNAVFTHPDLTRNDVAFFVVNARRQSTAGTLFEAVAYYRHGRTDTFNGDAADDDDDDDDGDGDEEEEEEEDDDEDSHGLELGAVNNTTLTRGRTAGLTAQITRVTPLAGRDNHFVAGAALDAAFTRFDSATELATLTPERGTIGTGLFEDDDFIDLHSRRTTAGAFVTNTWSVSPRWSLSGAARLNGTLIRMRDRIGDALSGDHRFWRVNPSGGVTYQAQPSLNLFAGVSQSSRVPTPVELTCADPADPCRLPNAFVSDPPLDQIVATTWEGGARGRLGRGRVAWTLAAFSTRSADDILFVSSGTARGEGHFENVPRTDRRGIEISADFEGTRFSAFGSYTFQRAVFGVDLRIASPQHPLADRSEIAVPGGARLPGVPAHHGKLGLAARIASGLEAAVDVRAQSGQFLRGDEANLLARVPGFAVVNGRARQRLTRVVAAVIEVHNVFDADHETFGVLGEPSLLGEEATDPRFFSPGPPRAAWGGLEIRF